MNVRSRFLLVVMAAFSVTQPLWSQDLRSMLPDPTKGEVNGRVAFAVIGYTDPGQNPVKTDGCEVHLVREADQSVEFVYPCVSWFAPPVGRYLMWVEQGSLVSYQSLTYYAGEKFTGAGKIILEPLYPAGTVRLGQSEKIPRNGTFRLLDLDVPEGSRRFDRRVLEEPTRPLRVPAGRVLGGIFDEAGGAVALARPAKVDQGKMTLLVPRVPESGTSDVMVALDRFVDKQPLPKCVATLQTGRSKRQPDVDMQSYDRIVNVWFGVISSGVAEIRIDCEGRTSLVKQIELTSGDVATVRGRAAATSH